MTVSPVPVNSSHPHFKVEVYGRMLTVTRTDGTTWTENVQFNAIKANGVAGGRLLQQNIQGIFGNTGRTTAPSKPWEDNVIYGSGDVMASPVLSESSAVNEIDFTGSNNTSYKWVGYFFKPPIADNFSYNHSSTQKISDAYYQDLQVGATSAPYNFYTRSTSASYALMYGAFDSTSPSRVFESFNYVDIDPVNNGGTSTTSTVISTSSGYDHNYIKHLRYPVFIYMPVLQVVVRL